MLQICDATIDRLLFGVANPYSLWNLLNFQQISLSFDEKRCEVFKHLWNRRTKTLDLLERVMKNRFVFHLKEGEICYCVNVISFNSEITKQKAERVADLS